jgi:hypothetical protein
LVALIRVQTRRVEAVVRFNHRDAVMRGY